MDTTGSAVNLRVGDHVTDGCGTHGVVREITTVVETFDRVINGKTFQAHHAREHVLVDWNTNTGVRESER